MLGKIIALIIVLFIIFMVYVQYEKCQSGSGGLFDRLCHDLV